jgi:hypothetical protein
VTGSAVAGTVRGWVTPIAIQLSLLVQLEFCHGPPRCMQEKLAHADGAGLLCCFAIDWQKFFMPRALVLSLDRGVFRCTINEANNKLGHADVLDSVCLE